MTGALYAIPALLSYTGISKYDANMSCFYDIIISYRG